MKQIALNTDLARPAACVMAFEHEMNVLSQAIEQSLSDQVSFSWVRE